MNSATQKRKILAYCRIHGSITVREAFVRLHINSPTKRISELRAAGFNVQHIDETRTNKDGETVKFRRYFISERGEERGNCESRPESPI